MSTNKQSPSSDAIKGAEDHREEVEFLGWQETFAGDIFPLYNVVKKVHPSFRSTVTEQTLQSLHLRIPRTPSPFPDTGRTPWHDQGTEVDNLATAKEAIVAAGLDFTVAKMAWKDIQSMNKPGDDSDRYATVRTDTGAVLGVVGAGYEPIQNRDAFAFFDTLIGSNDAIFETAGALEGGARVWILAKLPGYIKVHGKDIVGKYLLLSNSHDGSSLVRVKLTPIRVVCNNTLGAALKGAGDVAIRHTLDAAEDAKQALSLIGLSNVLFAKLDGLFNRMAVTKITDKQLNDYVTKLIPDIKTKGGVDVNTQDIRKAVLDLYESGLGAKFSRGTLWGAFNSITEYTDHMAEISSNARLTSSWFGQGEQLKLKAFELAEHMI